MLKELRYILMEIANLRDTTDIKGTIDSIRRSIPIKGYNIWILVCGAMLASIGLDTNSAAVIIGAMLISPLMSPILGIGMSVAINDREHLMKALENFGTAVAATLLVSALYFSITPLGDPTSELVARTYPTLLDVLIAIFGGVAGIVAISRKDKTNAIPGVAIATALMPPLCTAGFGIARFNWEFFAGAFYLFLINSIFIALSTYVVARFLRFPLMDYVDDATRRKAARWIMVFAILAVMPSAYFFYRVINKVRTERQIESFIEEKVNNGSHEVLKHTYTLTPERHELILVMGGPPVTEDSMLYLEETLTSYNIQDCAIRFIQGSQLEKDEILTEATVEILGKVQPMIAERDARIDSLKAMMTVKKEETPQMVTLQKDLSMFFPEIERIDFATDGVSMTDTTGKDSLALAIVTWKRNTSRTVRQRKAKTLHEWLTERMQLDSLRVVSP